MPTNFKKLSGFEKGTAIALVVVVLVLIAGGWYSMSKINSLSDKVYTLSVDLDTLNHTFSSTTATLTSNIAQTHNSLADALNQERQASQVIAQQLGTYQQQVTNVSSTVSVLQKLSATDPQLLAKYSKVFFLNENYIPARLTQVPNDYAYSDTKAISFLSDAWPFLKKMIDDAKAQGVTIYVSSAYRSFDEQSALKSAYKVTYGAGTANSFSADQGYSEHQLGTATDLITPGMGGQLTDAFDGTNAYAWLQANAYKYGFILSYPKGNAYYVYEPWHWRFVGVKLATDLHKQGKNFYDLDQRAIDVYLANFFDPQ